MNNNDDLIEIEDDDEDGLSFGHQMPTSKAGAWEIIVADDDVSAHRSTAFALENEIIEGRSVKLISAFSAREALEKVQEHPGAAAILLDVVMETPSAGLDAIAKIREDMGNRAIRIVVRSGAPGLMGEFEAVKRFDITDWRPKAELTQNKLLASITLAIRSYCEITAFEARQEGLDRALTFLERLAKDSTDTTLVPEILQALQEAANKPVGISWDWGGQYSAVWESFNKKSDQDTHHAHQLKGLTKTSGSASLGGEFPSGLGTRKDQGHQSKGQQVFDTMTFNGALDFDDKLAARGMWPYELEPFEFLSQKLSISLLIPVGEALDFTHPIVGALSRALRSSVIGQVKSILERDLVMLDSSTGLLNRQGFIQKSQELMSPNGTGKLKNVAEKEKSTAIAPDSWALYLIDLAGFSRVNAALGHEAGDRLLLDAAQRLKKLWPHSPLGRIASDSFAVVLPAKEYNPDHLDATFSEPLNSGRFPVSMKVRVGASPVRAEESASLWLTRAAAALDEAKMAGISGGAARWFDPQLEDRAVERIDISQKLFTTLKSRKGLFMVYQPQIDLSTGAVSGAEALIRWKDDNGVYIPPDRFVPIAEQAGLAHALSEFALESALNTVVKAKKAGIAIPKISVNISAVEFESEDLVHRVSQMLALAGVSAKSLELEITETAAAKDPIRMIAILDSLRQLGVSIAIDDFGSGYSSLAQLARLPVDKLKIDRAFVRAIGAQGPWGGIAKMIVDLGKSLNMHLVAEGVEELPQAIALHQMGADSAQGWLYAKGMIDTELFEYIKNSPYKKF